jgi:hypothetical protein
VDVVVVHAGEEPPGAWDAAVFLAGPSPRDPAVPSWRPEARRLLRERWAGSGRLIVFDPEHHRMAAATMSAHHAHLFSVELTAEELEPLRAGGAHGNLTESERTFPEVTTFGEIRGRRLVDWATLGMLTQVLSAHGPDLG